MKTHFRLAAAQTVSLIRSVARHPFETLRLVSHLPAVIEGAEFGRGWQRSPNEPLLDPPEDGSNPLREFFLKRRSGRGIWKWHHYFDVYHRHLAKFVGRDVSLVEVGIYSGGSLEMWRDYLGPLSRIYGVDIVSDCLTYSNEFTDILIGDQGDRGFWEHFKQHVPSVDILIDDGAHTPTEQITTLEEMLPHLRPGGVYVCEDVHGAHNPFHSYLSGVGSELNAFNRSSKASPVVPSSFQASIHSIHYYPYLIVIEKTSNPVSSFVATKRGSEWQPLRR